MPNYVVRVAGIVTATDASKQLRVLLARHRGHPFFTFPGGKLQVGETLDACLVRELLEETSLLVALSGLFALGTYISATEHVVEATFRAVTDHRPVVMGADGSLDSIAWYSIAQAGTLPISPRILWDHFLMSLQGDTAPLYYPVHHGWQET